MAAVPFDVDADRRAAIAQKLRPRQPERDQQDLVYPGMKRRGHLTQKHAGGRGIQHHRQTPSSGQRIHRGLDRGQRGRGRRHLPPHPHLTNDFWAACMLGQQRRPPRKRRPSHRQRYVLAAAMLGPGDVEVLHQNPPRHPVDGQMMNDQHQLARRADPQRRKHHPAGRVQSRPRPYHRLLGQHIHRGQAPTRIHRARFGHP
ncbi:hypothetical protein LAUMK13_03009 [Mycobacterium innocens]|uniref:Uncharacterized protein n=1 Tax=Mycobacterium innocens TaxID=2341083 RepID=A0A498Q4T4_9MYCO|nr:hypothetical protein LAUMK13_03009 [Mycobacterium innocens]